jgi:hypothetical protein
MKRLTLVVLIFLFFPLSACGSKELSREKAEALLGEALKDSFAKSCSLHPLLLKKPEFSAIKDEQFCKQSLVVTGIRKTSETEVVVEYKIITKVNSESLKKWLDAMIKLESRLLTLIPQKRGHFTYYLDPVDGQTCNCRFFSENITDSQEWETLHNLKRSASNLLEKGQLESKPLESIFRLYDDGWRISKTS